MEKKQQGADKTPAESTKPVELREQDLDEVIGARKAGEGQKDFMAGRT